MPVIIQDPEATRHYRVPHDDCDHQPLAMPRRPYYFTHLNASVTPTFALDLRQREQCGIDRLLH